MVAVHPNFSEIRIAQLTNQITLVKIGNIDQIFTRTPGTELPIQVTTSYSSLSMQYCKLICPNAVHSTSVK